MTRSVIRLLAMLCLMSLSGIAAVVLLVSPEWTAPEAQRPDMASLRPQLIAMPGASVSLDQIGQRPLFLESRRPHVPPTAAPQPESTPDPFPDAELVGLFGSGEEAGVIVRLKGDATRLRVGMQWSGWQLKSVDPVSLKAVFVSQGRGDHELRLKRQPQQGGMVATLETVSPSDADLATEPPDARVDGDEAGADSVTDPTRAAILARRAARAAALQSREQRANQQ